MAWLHPHRPERKAATRASACKRGYGRFHQKWRLAVLMANPICCMCHREPSVIADHIIPLVKGGDWSFENGQGLCHGCHGTKTRADNGA